MAFNIAGNAAVVGVERKSQDRHHFLQGHVDGFAEVRRLETHGLFCLPISIPTIAAPARLIGAIGRRRLTHVLIGTPLDTRMKSSCSRSSNAREILGSRSSQLDDTNANRDANRHHWSCDIDPQEPQMMKLR